MLGAIIGDIAGSIYEALHGIPDEFKERSESIYLSDALDMLEVLWEMYRRIGE